jgi:hypothetical protein
MAEKSYITNKIWEQQSYESAISYEYFQKYYLMQKHPRSLTRGYRRYLVENSKMPESVAVKKSAPNNWQKWSQGRKQSGEMLHPDAPTWSERARAYDEYSSTHTDEQMTISRNEILHEERSDAKKQLELWGLLFDTLEQYIQYQIDEAKKGGIPFDPIPFIARAKDLWKMRDELAAFSRRNLLLPDKYRDDPYGNEGDEPPGINWVEAEIDITDPDDIGVGREEIMELMLHGKKTN